MAVAFMPPTFHCAKIWAARKYPLMLMTTCTRHGMLNGFQMLSQSKLHLVRQQDSCEVIVDWCNAAKVACHVLFAANRVVTECNASNQS